MLLTQNKVLGDSLSLTQMVLAHMLKAKAGPMPGTLLMLNGTQLASKVHMETPGISPVKRISMVVKFAKTTSLSPMLMVILVQATMMPIQMVAVDMTPTTSLLQENAASVEVEAPEITALETSLGTCILPMMKLMDMQ